MILCNKCRRPTFIHCHVADSVEPEVEKAAHLKLGHYVNSVWIYDDYFRQTEGFAMASAADVSPNTPRVDEADIS